MKNRESDAPPGVDQTALQQPEGESSPEQQSFAEIRGYLANFLGGSYDRDWAKKALIALQEKMNKHNERFGKPMSEGSVVVPVESVTATIDNKKYTFTLRADTAGEKGKAGSASVDWVSQPMDIWHEVMDEIYD